MVPIVRFVKKANPIITHTLNVIEHNYTYLFCGCTKSRNNKTPYRQHSIGGFGITLELKARLIPKGLPKATDLYMYDGRTSGRGYSPTKSMVTAAPTD